MSTLFLCRQLFELLERRAVERPSDPAVESPDRPPMSYGELIGLVRRIRDQLRTAGIGPDGCVATVLKNGPTAATGFAAFASCCAFAPLNPGYRRAEFEFYLGDLKRFAKRTSAHPRQGRPDRNKMTAMWSVNLDDVVATIDEVATAILRV